jgi:hypothetical protein
MTEELYKLQNQVLEIMEDFEGQSFPIECCDIKINGALLIHCYHDEVYNLFFFSSGDMEEDKHAEEIILTDEQKTEVFQAIIECYS